MKVIIFTITKEKLDSRTVVCTKFYKIIKAFIFNGNAAVEVHKFTMGSKFHLQFLIVCSTSARRACTACGSDNS